MIVERGCVRYDDGHGAKFKIVKRLQFEEQNGTRNERERKRGREGGRDNNGRDWRITGKVKEEKKMKIRLMREKERN